MTTIAAAWGVLRSRAESSISLPMYWPNESIRLPDTPTAFVYFEIDPQLAFVAGFGGGRGANLYRNQADLNAFVFVPVEEGIELAMTYGETVAAVFRSFRDANVSCFEASVHPIGRGAELTPPGLSAIAGNYFCAVVIVAMHFDQVG